MIVSRQKFEEVLDLLIAEPKLSVDTETTGLRVHHGDKLFAIIVGSKSEVCYFNFMSYPDIDPDLLLGKQHLEKLRFLFECPKTWYFFNAPFDLAMLKKADISVNGTIHDCAVVARLEHNDHFRYNLAACAERIGLEKSDAVEKYITEHHLWEWVQIPGKKRRDKNKFYYKVPFDIMSKYGEQDGRITYGLGEHQENFIRSETEKTPRGLPTLQNLLDTERRLTQTVFRMEQVGLQIDRDYCVRAALYESERASQAALKFKEITNSDFKDSGKSFESVFAAERELWEYTEKGNPSFEVDVLKKFKNPAARAILDFRDARSKANFYHGFLHYADLTGVIHPHLDSGGTATGRFSSYEPNFQNLTSEEDEEELKQEFVVRRAIVPRPGYFLIMPDYDQMEYKLMLELACRIVGRLTPIAAQVKDGYDVHQATADAVTAAGFPLPRKKAKNGNFAILYGSGYDTLAAQLGATREEAKAIKGAIFRASPELREFIDLVSNTAKRRGFIFNWAGRRSYFPDSNFAYRAPNYIIQGGCADIVKRAMNEVDQYLLNKKSRMILQVHDELVIEVHESEAQEVPQRVKEIMESVFVSQYLPLTCGMEYSLTSMADKVKGFPA
jgi:DNA polymerase-1